MDKFRSKRIKESKDLLYNVVTKCTFDFVKWFLAFPNASNFGEVKVTIINN